MEPNDCGNVRPLIAAEGRLYGGHGYRLVCSDDGGKSYGLLAKYKVPIWRSGIAHSRVGIRLLREGFHSIAKSDDGTIVAVVRGAILMLKKGGESFKCVFRIKRGSRPLNICWIPKIGFVFGEYFSNEKRVPVHIYASQKGDFWSSIYTFPKGSIRHIHGIYYDPFREGVWVLTGDRDEESGLWFSSDGFRTVNPIARGSQRARAVSILPVDDGLIVPMDSPIERNYIHHVDVATGTFTRLAELPGSAFYTSRLGEFMFVSTVVEPSKINVTQHAALYVGTASGGWRCMARYERCRANVVEKYMSYPSLVLAPSDGRGDQLYAYGIGLCQYDRRCISWSLEQIRDIWGNM